MMEIEKALVVGAGAVGAAIATMIQDADPAAVALCATGERRARLAREGLVVNGRRRDFQLADAGRDGTFGLVIVAVKNHHLRHAISDMRPFVGEGTRIVSLLNGITSERTLAGEFPDAFIPLAMIIGIDAIRIGGSIDFPKPGEIRFGEPLNPPGSWSEGVASIARFFASHGVPHSVPEDMLRTLWYKFMFNVGLNQWSAVLRAPYGVFQRFPEARELIRRTMREVVTLARVLSIPLSEDDIDTTLAVLDTLGPEGRTSMLQDVDAGRKTEVEIFSGEVISIAAGLGTPVPLNQALFEALSVMERSYSSAR